MMSVIYKYFVEIKPGRLVLWCYLLWYLVTLYYHFDPSPKLWINSLGISGVIGTALMLSVAPTGGRDYWQIFRLYWMPFAVSSFAALIKNQNYFIIFSPDITEVLTAIFCCSLFVALVMLIKYFAGNNPTLDNNKPA
ncbi:MAG TPA: hypothetical protein VN030_02390 [Cellvibrio sp.]|nr:hypothetical protein [Cellvibrio sp.]